MTKSEIVYKQAIRYHYLTERYDRTICAARTPDGNAIPTLPGERGMMVRYAMSLKKTILTEMKSITAAELQKAIMKVADKAYDELQREYERYFGKVPS